MILETFFLAEEKHPYSVLCFQDLSRARPMSPISPAGTRVAVRKNFRSVIIYGLKIAFATFVPNIRY
jgi:hypothetical protein